MRASWAAPAYFGARPRGSGAETCTDREENAIDPPYSSNSSRLAADPDGMTRSACYALAVSVLFFGASACSSSGDAGPRSREALHKADPLQYGCAYVSVKHSSYGTYSSTDKTPQCTQGERCDELKSPDSYRAYAGDNAFDSSEYFDKEVNFTGTCAQQTALPVPGPSSKCYAAPYLCDHDPNCMAIRDCVTTCGTDAGCSAECIANGDYTAASNFRASLECEPTKN